ncbi:MAG: MFS transporter [Bacteroidota bacterium]
MIFRKKYASNSATGICGILKSEEFSVGWSFLFFCTLMMSYAIMRPLRDEMGIRNGVDNLQWLFTGSFIVMIGIVPVFGYLISRVDIGTFKSYLYGFLVIGTLSFYFLFREKLFVGILPGIFFIWLSVFSLFTISLFWSFMVDIFSSAQSRRLFGIISAGGSLGALLGSLVVTTFSGFIEIETLLLVSAVLLLVSLVSLRKILSRQTSKLAGSHHTTFLPKRALFDAFRLIFSSRYLMSISLFIFCYTVISTVLYFEQAALIDKTLISVSERIKYFSIVELIINVLAFLGQFFLTQKIFKKYDLSTILILVPIVTCIGLLALIIYPTMYLITLALIVIRIGNYIVLRPGKEILYTVRNREEKYKVKNIIDTSVYRVGDSMSSWCFAFFISIGFGFSTIALIILPLVCFWAYLGFQIGEKHKSLVKVSKA